MKIILLLKLLLNYYYKTFRNLKIFYYCLFQIKIFSLFQKFGKIFLKSLIFLSTYLYFFIQKYINKLKLLIKR